MDFAAAEGFFGLELMCWYSDGLLESAETVKRDMDERGLEIITMGFWGNNLDPTEREAWQRRQAGVIDLAAKWGSEEGRHLRRPRPDDRPRRQPPGRSGRSGRRSRSGPRTRASRSASRTARCSTRAASKSINIATSPVIWERMFDEVDSPALGLQFDPSHLVLAADRLPGGAAQVRAEGRPGPREGHRDPLGRAGADRHPRPGLVALPLARGSGQSTGRRSSTPLREIGYKGDIAIEHEDPLYEGEKAHEGLLLARKNLDQALGG